MEDDDDWDLHAVVRRCNAAATTTCLPDKQNPPLLSSEMTISPPPVPLPLPSFLLQNKHQNSSSRLPYTKNRNKATVKMKKKKKKKELKKKKVCHVAADEVASDVWSWRKYGQKPIKGSPFPRGYYRCSTSKECVARKQVERNRSDPGMFILTYTGDHNHPLPIQRNSLSGGSRRMTTTTGENSTLNNSNAKPFSEKLDMNDDDISPLGDDFFEGLEGFIGGECSKDDFPDTFIGDNG